jgi:hypothetical protein
MQGITEYDHNGVHVLRIHYTADPAKQTKEWIDEQKKGTTAAAWEQEMEINFNAIQAKAWFPEFRRDFHVAREPLQPIPGRPILRGWDYGLTPATVYEQSTAKGQILVLYPELQSWDNGITAHAKVVKSESQTYFPQHKFTDYGDPAGNIRAQTDEKTCVQILANEFGINVINGPVSEMARHEPVRNLLTSLTPDGQPMLLIDPRCTWLIQALEGGYQHKKVAERYIDEVADNEYTHIVDAFMYPVAMVAGKKEQKTWKHTIGGIL